MPSGLTTQLPIMSLEQSETARYSAPKSMVSNRNAKRTFVMARCQAMVPCKHFLPPHRHLQQISAICLARELMHYGNLLNRISVQYLLFYLLLIIDEIFLQASYIPDDQIF